MYREPSSRHNASQEDSPLTVELFSVVTLFDLRMDRGPQKGRCIHILAITLLPWKLPTARSSNICVRSRTQGEDAVLTASFAEKQELGTASPTRRAHFLCL